MKIPRLIILCICLLTQGLWAETTLSSLFGNHMVLQRDMPVEVWGWDEPAQNITLKFGGVTAETTTNSDGEWRITLPPMPANKTGLAMTVNGSSEVNLKDILIGEVWVLFGRSNVGFPLLKSTNGKEVAAESNYPLIRSVSLFGKPTLEPQKDVVTRGWKDVNPKTALRMSAVGYYFARALQRDTDVPVGLIKSGWGGSPGYMWIERSIYEKSFPPGTKDQNLDWLEEFEAESHQYHKSGSGAREYSDERKNERIGALYHPFVEPILGMSCRGIIFYCSGTTAAETEIVSKTWRSAWGNDDLPFLYVQIPPSGGDPEGNQPFNDPSFNASFEAMNRSGRIQNSAMIITLDTGAKSGKRDIHPPVKEPVGERLALAARGLGLSEDVVYLGPRYLSHQVEGGQITVHFTNDGNDLKIEGEELEGFAVSEDGKNWTWAESAKIEGDSVVVESGLGNPQHVRYGIFAFPTGNLYNEEGLPVAPFSTAVTYP